MDPQRSSSLPPNSSPRLAWGSPAAPPLRHVSTFPPNGSRSPNLPSASPSRSGPPASPSPGAIPPGIGSAPMQWLNNVGDMGMNSPQFLRHQPPRMFRTPQPQSRASPAPGSQRSPWSDNRANHRNPRFSMTMNHSPQSSPHSSPKPYHFGGRGGSPLSSPRHNHAGSPVTVYYKPSMLQDPWRNVLPVSTKLEQKGFP